ncbi:MAG TPA: hypothetical protein ENH24_01450 [Nitrospirae bacterium]|nr:hypothetical protein [Nitrospirota bacterium]
MSDSIVLISKNIAIDQSQGSSCVLLPAINAQDLPECYDTVFLPIAQSTSIIEDQSVNIRELFGSWVESGDEDKQLKEIYESRQIPSGSLDE